MVTANDVAVTGGSAVTSYPSRSNDVVVTGDPSVANDVAVTGEVAGTVARLATRSEVVTEDVATQWFWDLLAQSGYECW